MRWKALTCGVAMTITIGLAAPGKASTITLSPSLENTLIQDASAGTGQVSNALGDVFAGRTNQAVGSSIRRGLIEFDIAGNLPSNATVTGGTLTMTDAMGTNGNQTLNLHETLQAWGDGASNSGSGAMGVPATNNDATWLYTFYNASNPSASPTWSTPGGSYSLTLSDSAVDVATGSAGYQVVWSSASNSQMKTDLQGWLDDPGTNFGWTIVGNESIGMTAKHLYGDNDAPNLAPELMVSYTVPEPSTAWLLLSGLCGLAVVKSRPWRQRTLKKKQNPMERAFS